MVACSLEALNIMDEFIQHIESNDWLEWDYYTTADVYYMCLQGPVDKNIILFISISNQIMEGDSIFRNYIQFLFSNVDIYTEEKRCYGFCCPFIRQAIVQKISFHFDDQSYVNMMEGVIQTLLCPIYATHLPCIYYVVSNYRRNIGIPSTNSPSDFIQPFQQLYTVLQQSINIIYEFVLMETQTELLLQRFAYHFHVWIDRVIHVISPMVLMEFLSTMDELKYIILLLQPVKAIEQPERIQENAPSVFVIPP